MKTTTHIKTPAQLARAMRAALRKHFNPRPMEKWLRKHCN